MSERQFSNIAGEEGEYAMASEAPPGVLEKPAFRNGELVAPGSGTKGASIPEFYDQATGIAWDSKNYAINTDAGRARLIENITQQYAERLVNLPAGSQQVFVVEARMPGVTPEMLEELRADIASASGIAPANIVFRR
jgi:hypothetical protein